MEFEKRVGALKPGPYLAQRVPSLFDRNVLDDNLRLLPLAFGAGVHELLINMRHLRRVPIASV